MATVADFMNAVRDSQLLDGAQLDEVSQELLPRYEDPKDLAQQLTQRGWLTPYQADQLLEGQPQNLVLGPFRLLEPLGEGGMGQVFKALHQRLSRIVALKVVRQERLSQNPEAIRRFQREARAAAQLHHPNVVLIYDADQIGDTHFIAMEYVEGTDLARLVKERGPLPVPDASDYIRQAAVGLQHAYECGLVHRDIKPSNLIVTYVTPANAKTHRGISGLHLRPSLTGVTRERASSAEVGRSTPALPRRAVVKILDMGLARLTDPMDAGSSSSALTQEGLVMGTPDFIAPEQARNAHAADIRSDLYSLGGTFYFLLTGRPPFPEGGAIEKLLMHQLDEPRPVEELRPQVPPEVLGIVRKLMAR
jgi:serine/threonine protein kinase